MTNCDETGYFYRAIPRKTLVLKQIKSIGIKWLKERLTVFMSGFSDQKVKNVQALGKVWNLVASKF